MVFTHFRALSRFLANMCPSLFRLSTTKFSFCWKVISLMPRSGCFSLQVVPYGIRLPAPLPQSTPGFTTDLGASPKCSPECTILCANRQGSALTWDVGRKEPQRHGALPCYHGGGTSTAVLPGFAKHSPGGNPEVEKTEKNKKNLFFCTSRRRNCTGVTIPVKTFRVLQKKTSFFPCPPKVFSQWRADFQRSMKLERSATTFLCSIYAHEQRACSPQAPITLIVE